MTLECVIRRTDSWILTCAQNSRPIPSLRLRVQPWLMLSIACVCLTQALRLLFTSDSLGIPLGLVLLLIFPRCCYLGWRDSRALKEHRVALALRWYLNRVGRIDRPQLALHTRTTRDW